MIAAANLDGGIMQGESGGRSSAGDFRLSSPREGG
jgi:hypothetical protein